MTYWNDQDHFTDNHDAFGISDEPPKLDNRSTPEIPPAYDGRSSWFAYEESIDDWLDITTLPPEKHGPSLKNRLYGDAAIYKPLLDRDLLNDQINGVIYFKKCDEATLREGQPDCFLMEILSIPPMLPWADGHAEMDWTPMRDQETRARRMDGPAAAVYEVHTCFPT